MENSVCINQQSIAIKEYKGQRVVTFKDIDAVHGRPDGTARRNFWVNRKYLIEGEDYVTISRNTPMNEIRTLGFVNIPPKGIILITQTGYLMLVKSFTDELAWKVQRLLVNNYFNAREVQQHEQLQLEEPYQYIEKIWKGQKVLTITDMVKLGEGFERSVISYWARARLVKNDDYFLLSGIELAEFKSQYPNMFKMVNHMYLFTYNGFRKIVQYTGGKCEQLKKLAQPTPPVVKPQMMDTPNYVKAQSAINDIKNKLQAIDEVLDGMNRHIAEEEHRNYAVVARNLGVEIGVLVMGLADMKIPTVDRRW